MKIALIIASRGRPQVLAQVLGHWAAQSRRLDSRVVSVSCKEDIGDQPAALADHVSIGPLGSCVQRNRALDFLASTPVDVVIFADDDYVPSRHFVLGVEALFTKHPDIVVATGKILADGVRCGGISYEDALRLVDEHDASGYHITTESSPTTGGYGCNTAARVCVDRSIRFDERLPLYGWQEDIDYTRRYRHHGRIVNTTAFAGVHMGMQGARSPGKRLGYSQIVNPVYLIRKGTMPAKFGAKLIVRNFMANLLGALRGDHRIDRTGRLKGNLVGLAHLMSGRARPEYVLNL